MVNPDNYLHDSTINRDSKPLGRENSMPVERCDYYSDEEYQQALQMQAFEEAEEMNRMQAERMWSSGLCLNCEYPLEQCVCKEVKSVREIQDDEMPF